MSYAASRSVENCAYAYFTRNFLPSVMQLADKKQSPSDVAKYIARLAGTTPGMGDVIGRVIAEDNMIERLATTNPEVMQHAAWFDEVADWLAHALWPDTNPAPDAENATTDATTSRAQEPGGLKVAKVDGAGDDPANDDLAASDKPIDDANADTSDTVRNDDT